MKTRTAAFLVSIMGPTGAGKTAAALALARRLPSAVVNTDSRQVYRDFPLITAQPSADERAVCPHLLYGFLPTRRAFGAGAFARAAAGRIASALGAGRLPLLVGGTGLYFRALLEGMAPIPPSPPELAAAWQRRCDEEGPQALHALLARSDPGYAAKIHPNDRQRITRALEVMDATGKPFSWWHARPLPPPPYAALRLGVSLPMPELEKALAGRIDLMLERGALAEAEAALGRCPDPAAPGWSGIGCAELRGYLAGDLSLDECRALWLKNTRAYAKRQNTWFRADERIVWFRPEEAESLADYALAALEAHGSGAARA